MLKRSHGLGSSPGENKCPGPSRMSCSVARSASTLASAICGWRSRAALLQALIAEAERATGHSAESVNYCTEAPFVQQLGCDTLVLGPGHIAQAHQPDEYLDLSFVKPTKEVLTHLVRRFCF